MLKKALFFFTVATVFSAVAVSAKQLTVVPLTFAACGSPCVVTTTACMKPCYCFITQEGSLNGTCQPEGPLPLRQPASTNSRHSGL